MGLDMDQLEHILHMHFENLEYILETLEHTLEVMDDVLVLDMVCDDTLLLESTVDIVVSEFLKKQKLYFIEILNL